MKEKKKNANSGKQKVKKSLQIQEKISSCGISRAGMIRYKSEGQVTIHTASCYALRYMHDTGKKSSYSTTHPSFTNHMQVSKNGVQSVFSIILLQFSCTSTSY